MADEENEKFMRSVPQSDLDLNLMLTDPVWGSKTHNAELIEQFKGKDVHINEDGTVKELEDGAPDLTMYTRDLRLANLNKLQTYYAEYYIVLAGDLAMVGMKEPFKCSLRRPMTTLELSQSKDGFTRKRFGTFTHEQYKTEIEPKKRSIFGGTKTEPGA